MTAALSSTEQTTQNILTSGGENVAAACKSLSLPNTLNTSLVFPNASNKLADLSEQSIPTSTLVESVTTVFQSNTLGPVAMSFTPMKLDEEVVTSLLSQFTKNVIETEFPISDRVLEHYSHDVEKLEKLQEGVLKALEHFTF